MRSFSILSLFGASSLLLTSATAFPLFPRIQQRAPASYSVVPVDGGSSTGAGSTATETATATVTDATTQTQTLVSTLLSTLVVSASETAISFIIEQTTTVETTIVETPAPVTSIVTSVMDASPTTVSADTPASTITLRASAASATVTIYETPIVSVSTYDDGQWHTYYGQTYTDWANAVSTPTSAPSSSEIETPPVPTSSSWATTTSSVAVVPTFIAAGNYTIPAGLARRGRCNRACS